MHDPEHWEYNIKVVETELELLRKQQGKTQHRAREYAMLGNSHLLEI